MKRRFTILTAALALLAFLTVPLGMWGQTWEATSLSDLTTSDVFVIVSSHETNGTYAMSNNNGTGTAPAAVAVTISNNTLSGTISDNIKWNVSGNAIEGYTFYPNGSTASWLYCTAANNGVRVGTNANKAFKIQDEYLYNSATSRYIGVYNKADWRCYTSINNNIKDQTFTFYKYVASTTTVEVPTISPNGGNCLNGTTQSVEMSCATSGATIYYSTTSATGPWTIYSNAISITGTSETKTVWAYATKSGMTDSGVTSAEFVFVAPMSVAEAIAALNQQSPINNAYVSGIICQVDSYNSTYHSITYWISDDGTTTTKLQVYSGKGLNGADFSSANDLEVGSEVVVYGNLKIYNSTYEFDVNSVIVSMTTPIHDVATPTFSPAAGTYADAQTVTMSCTTEGADIYYTLDGTDPDMNSSMYENPIEVSETTTIKAVAYDGNDTPSTIATATYHINSQANPYTVAQALAFNEYPANGIYVHGIVSTAPTQDPTNNGELTYYISDNGEASNELEVYKGKGLNQAAFTAQDDIQVGDIVTIYGNVQVYNSTIEFGSGNYLVEFERPASAEPSITVEPLTVNATAEGMEDASLTVTTANLNDFDHFDVQFYSEDGQSTADPADWIGPFDLTGPITFDIYPNEGNARTAYLKVQAFYGENQIIESELVTINQAAYVADYAVLPFEWEGGSSADFLALNGTSANGLGTDYASNNSPYLIKLDGTGDYIQVKTDSRPGIVTIGVKMIGGANTSTITVQGSSDGENFTDIQVLTISGIQNAELTLETTGVFAENDRYVRLYFTKGSNVGVGPITIAKYTEPAHAIDVDPDLIVVGAEGGEGGFEYIPNWLDGGWAEDFEFYDAPNGETIDQPDWITIVLQIGENEDYHYTIAANNGEARTAYFKAWTYDDDNVTKVYSNLVTVNQAAAPQPSITVTPDVYDFTAEGAVEFEFTATSENIEDFSDFDFYFTDSEGNPVTTTSPEWITIESISSPNFYFTIAPNEGDARTAYFKVFIAPADGDMVLSNLVTINQAAYVVPPTPGTWVLTDLAELTEDDIFVIVGDNGDTYAMSNDKGTSAAPAAVAVTVVEGTLSAEPAANLQWNISITENGYTFNPNGSTETWLYCTNTNNGVRVGTNTNNVFVLDNESGYLKNVATSRYIGIYDSQDWRCYTNTTGNIANQTFAFYKKVAEPATETHDLTINGYTSDDDGWYLIASPVSTTPSEVTNMLNDTYDLYRFNQAAAPDSDGITKEWENYRIHQGDFNIVPGQGYLYANSNTVELSFTGTPYSGNGTITLVNAGWNLVGNPFGFEAIITDKDCYTINDEHTGIMPEISTRNIAVMEGVFVQASAAGETVTFSRPAKSNDNRSAVVMNLSQGRGTIDRAIVRFGNNNTLPKFQLFENSTKLYIAQNGEDFAIVNADNQGEMPVSFKANKNGQYTITVNAEGVEMNYLHLIDNMTGADVDLLQTPSYSFEAKTTDYESRFRLVFSNESASEANFAYFNGSEWVVNGNGTLQVIDVMGRILSSQNVDGSVNVNAAPGVYMIRLINGDNVKTQKVVVR